MVQALSSNSALPEAVTGGRGRGDDSDEEDDEEEEPLDQVIVSWFVLYCCTSYIIP